MVNILDLARAKFQAVFRPSPQQVQDRRAILQRQINLPRPVATVVRALQPGNILRTAIVTNPTIFATGTAARSVPGSIYGPSAGNRVLDFFKEAPSKAYEMLKTELPTSFKQYAKAYGATIATEEVIKNAYNLATGNPVSIIPRKEELQYASYGALNRPLAAAVFGGSYLAKLFGQGGKAIVSTVSAPDLHIPIVTDSGYNLPRAPPVNVTIAYPDLAAAGTLPSLQAPSANFAPSVSVQGSAGGFGGGEIAAILAALGLGAGAGYLARKRKKYKRKKSKRKHVRRSA